jgi:hypothetical protein
MDIKNKEVFNIYHFKKGRKVYEMTDSLVGNDCVEVKPEVTLKLLIVGKSIFTTKGRFCGFVGDQTFHVFQTDYATDLFHDQDDKFLIYNNPKKSYYKKKKDRI